MARLMELCLATLALMVAATSAAPMPCGGDSGLIPPHCLEACEYPVDCGEPIIDREIIYDHHDDDFIEHVHDHFDHDEHFDHHDHDDDCYDDDIFEFDDDEYFDGDEFEFDDDCDDDLFDGDFFEHHNEYIEDIDCHHERDCDYLI